MVSVPVALFFQIYQRSLDQTMSADIQVPTEVLKTEVTNAVSLEV